MNKNNKVTAKLTKFLRIIKGQIAVNFFLLKE